MSPPKASRKRLQLVRIVLTAAQACLADPGCESCLRGFTSSHLMSDTLTIHGHEIIELVSQYPDGIRLGRLMEVVDERFGKSVTFHTGSSMGMDLDALLRFLEARDKIRITGGVVFPEGSPACEH